MGYDYLEVGGAINRIIKATGVNAYAKSRSKNRILLRRAIFHALRGRGLSYPEIGELFQRDHTTVMNGIKKFNSEHNPFTSVVAKFLH